MDLWCEHHVTDASPAIRHRPGFDLRLHWRWGSRRRRRRWWVVERVHDLHYSGDLLLLLHNLIACLGRYVREGCRDGRNATFIVE